MSILIQNGTVINADATTRADVLIEGEHIVQVAPHIPPAGHTLVDATGLLVLPGGIDVHTHLDMPFGGTTSADDYLTGTRAAAIGGTTTVIDFALQSRGHTLAEALTTWNKKAANKACIDYSLHMAITDLGDLNKEGQPETLAEMRDMVAAGITSFKLFMAYPNVLMIEDGLMFQVMQQRFRVGRACFDPCRKRPPDRRHGSPGARPRRNRSPLPRPHPLGRKRSRSHPPRHSPRPDGRSHRLHRASVEYADSLRELKQAQARGLHALAETCTQYLVLSLEDQMPGTSFDEAKLRLHPAPAQTRKPCTALGRLGRWHALQVVSTDHCPFTTEQKALGKARLHQNPQRRPRH